MIWAPLGILIFGKVQKDSIVQVRHFSYYFVLLALFMKWRPPRCQNKYFFSAFGRGGDYSIAFPSKAQFPVCLWGHDNKFLSDCRQHESEIVSSGASGYITYASSFYCLFILHCTSQTLFRAFALLAALHISRRSLWKATPQRLYWENRCSSFSF